MVTISNHLLTVEIDPVGAEMKRILAQGKDRLWSGDPAYWSGRAPVLFPICGGLPNDQFTFEGKAYTLMKHGFARKMMFTVVAQTDICAVFSLKSNEETRRSYPWDFELLITYSLRGTCIDIQYEVRNDSGTTMYMSIGSHEAYACPEGIEEYDLIFEKKETLSSCDLDGNLIAPTVTPILKETDTLPLYEKFFAIDALIFKDVRSRAVTLRNRKTGEKATVEFPGCHYLLIWQKKGAPYICIEPWTGIPPMVGSDPDITKKEGITAVAPHDTFRISHSIYFG